MRLLVDIDGTVCRYNFPALTEKFFGVQVPQEAIQVYSVEDSLGVPSWEVNKMFAWAVHQEPMFEEGARRTLEHFLEQGDNITVWTNRRQYMTPQELTDWLDRFGIPYDGIVAIPSNKNPYDYHIDDSITKLMNTDGAVKHKLLYDQPWNRMCLDIRNSLQRVHGWQEVKEIIDEARNSH